MTVPDKRSSASRGGSVLARRLATTFELDRFIADCQAVAKSETAAEEIETLISEAMSDLDGVGSSLGSPQLHQTLNDAILFRSPDLFILNSALIPGLISPPHDHAMWTVVGLYQGQEDNIFYKRKYGTLEVAERRSLKPADVVRLNADVIHSVSNPLDQLTLAIHVYGGDLLTADRCMWNPFTKQECRFEMQQFLTFSLELMRQPCSADSPFLAE